MNRKEGIDYFPVKCAADKNIELVTAECGLKAHAVIYALLQEIYGVHGYYCEWQREKALSLSSRMFGGGDRAVNRINEIVNCCARWGVFSLEQLEENGILTSEEIQENFLFATKRRKSVKMKRAYLLVKVALLPDNVIILDENVDILDENADILKHSKSNSKYTNTLSIVPTLQEVKDYATNNRLKINPEKFFEYYERVDWKDKYGRRINWKSTADYWNKTERADQKPSGNTKSGYSTKKKNQFNSFNQRDISSSDMSELEQRLLNRG